MTAARKNLKGIARTVWEDRVLGKRSSWTFKTHQLMSRYKLDEAQAQKVKHYIRELAFERGLLWGYDPKNKYFTLAPHNRPDIAKRILHYFLKQWQLEGKDAPLIFGAARKQGFIDILMEQSVKDVSGEFDPRIAALIAQFEAQIAEAA